MTDENQTNEQQQIPRDRQPFDQHLAALFREAVFTALQEVPELRSVTVVFDYQGDLNGTNLPPGIWAGELGLPTRSDEIRGSIQQMFHMLDHQYERAQALGQRVRDELQVLDEERQRSVSANEEGDT